MQHWTGRMQALGTDPTGRDGLGTCNGVRDQADRKEESLVHCQPEDSRRLLDRQLPHHDHALEVDPGSSGMPPSFVEETWVNWLPKAVAQPFYRDQLTAHVAELERQISNLSREIERQSGGLLDQRDAAVVLRQRLKRLLETS